MQVRPSLIDIFCDESPGEILPYWDSGYVSMQAYRQGVLRDLSWLFNSNVFFNANNLTVGEFSKNSVLNFGIPNIIGKSISSLGQLEIRNILYNSVIRYEPRIRADSLVVQSMGQDNSNQSPTRLVYEISGELVAAPLVDYLQFRTELDTDFGKIQLYDSQSSGK